MDTQPKTKRAYRYFVSYKCPSRESAVILASFATKSEMRKLLCDAEFDGEEIRVIRGYEMSVGVKRSFSVS